jgi:dTDP-4-amino-4,6-dideoxygalactose transaminase
MMVKLKQAGIQTSLHYPPIHLFTYYQQNGAYASLELTEALAGRELTLPLFPGMNEEDVNLVVSSIKGFFD